MLIKKPFKKGFGFSGAPYYAGSSLDPATSAWVSAVVSAGGSVSAPRQAIVDTFIKALKSASLWSILDRYWLFASEDQTGALIDMVNLQTATAVGTPTFTASVGFTSASAKYINTGFIPSTSGVNFTLNSASWGIQFQNNRTASNAILNGAGGSGFTLLNSFNPVSAVGAEYRINDSTSGGAANASTLASWIATRTASNAKAMYRNGVSHSTSSAASTGLTPVALYVGGFNSNGTAGNYSTEQQSCFFVGGGMTATQAGNFETAQNAMMTSIGINVH